MEIIKLGSGLLWPKDTTGKVQISEEEVPIVL